MGPRLDSRGRLAGIAEGLRGALASMGPRLDSRGRNRAPAAEPAKVTLQWGRGWTAAEGSTSWTKRPLTTSFNGAAAGQPRKGAGR